MQAIHVSLYALILIVAMALIFDFMNGFHDAANAIATVVSTGVLKPHTAVAMTAFMNCVAIFVFDLHVATTVGKGTVDPAIVDHYVVFGALVGAIGWNIITWYYGIPSSSSHALIGGLIGAAIAKAGSGSLIASGIFKIIAFIVISPLLGFLLGSIMMVLVASGYAADNGHLPLWVVISCYGAIGFGTLFGGWRIVKTMGQKITKLKPVGGFCAETGGAMTLFIATALGIPVSTTHTITGAIVGVGSAQKTSAVRWGVASNIVWAWILTIPASAFIAAIAWWVGTKFL